MLSNPYRTVSEIGELPYDVRQFLRNRAYAYEVNPDEDLPRMGCPVKSVLSATLPPVIRNALLSYLVRPPKEKISDAQFAAIVGSSGVRPNFRKHLASTLRHAAISGNDVLADLAALKRNRPEWFA